MIMFVVLGFAVLAELPALAVLAYREGRVSSKFTGLLAAVVVGTAPLWFQVPAAPFVVLMAGWCIASHRRPRRMLAGSFAIPLGIAGFGVLGTVVAGFGLYLGVPFFFAALALIAAYEIRVVVHLSPTVRMSWR